MAGSGFPPLTNIPYCCLPQESGPCLSTSVGDRPLRSPTHRRLGGPSPRLPSNGTHARPPPRLRLAEGKMPPPRRIRCYPAFPPAIPERGVGCIRVTHPSATLNPPKGILPFDLHVLGLPLAFILSQDQTLRCTIVPILFLPSHGPASAILVPYLGSFRFPMSLGIWNLCWPQTVKELLATLLLRPTLLPLIAGCKDTTFFITRKQKNDFFCKNNILNCYSVF